MAEDEQRKRVAIFKQSNGHTVVINPALVRTLTTSPRSGDTTIWFDDDHGVDVEERIDLVVEKLGWSGDWP